MKCNDRHFCLAIFTMEKLLDREKLETLFYRNQINQVEQLVIQGQI
jgi:hypothetical protein